MKNSEYNAGEIVKIGQQWVLCFSFYRLVKASTGTSVKKRSRLDRAPKGTGDFSFSQLLLEAKQDPFMKVS